MKLRRFITSALAAILALTTFASVSVSASATPVDGGKTLFKAEDFKIDYDSVNGNGAFKAYRADMEVVNVDGKDAVKFTAQNEAKQALIDFSYYQYNNSEYLPALNTKEYKFLKVSYKRAAASKADFTFWKSVECELGKGLPEKTYNFRADSTTWDSVIIDLSKIDGLEWSDVNVRSLRLYPWGMVSASNYAGETFYLEYFGFFKTEAEAKAFTLDKKTETKPATAPATFDMTAVMAVCALTSASAAFVISKRKAH